MLYSQNYTYMLKLWHKHIQMEPEQGNATARKGRHPSQCLAVDMAEGKLWLLDISFLTISWWLGRWLSRT